MCKYALLLAALVCGMAPAQAYEVWLGLLCVPGQAAKDTASWSTTAKLAEGLNVNMAPVRPKPGTPTADYTRLTKAQEKTIVAQIAHRDNGMIEFPRSRLEKSSMDEWVKGVFTGEDNRGYGIKYVMFYDNASKNENGEQTEKFTWTKDEVQALRDSLNRNGHTETKLLFDLRNNGVACRKWASNPLVDAVMIEAKADLWTTNDGHRQELLKWLWTDPQTVNKTIIFQIPADNSEAVNNYMKVRRLLRFFGTELMSAEFMRSPRVVFLPVSYNPPAPFHPETAPGDPGHYLNTMTGLVLSLIEQRPLFEQRTQVPTEADCDSFVRKP